LIMVYLTFDNVAFNAEYGDGKDYLTEAVLLQENRRARKHESKASEHPLSNPPTPSHTRKNKPGILKLKVISARVCRFCSLDHNKSLYRVMARSRSRERRRSRSRGREGRKSPARWSREEKKQQWERKKSATNDLGLVSASSAAASAARTAIGDRTRRDITPPRRVVRPRHERVESSAATSAEKSTSRSPPEESAVVRSMPPTVGKPAVTEPPAIVKPKRTPITPPEMETPAKKIRAETSPIASVSSSRVKAAGQAASESLTANVKEQNTFQGAYDTAEYISESHVGQVEQAAGYGQVGRNFMGSRRNFEYVAIETRTPNQIKADRNDDEKRSMWRMRMLSHGQATDLTMMICHPVLYSAAVMGNPAYVDSEGVSDQDRICALGIFRAMTARLRVKHVPSASDLPDMKHWDEVMSKHPMGPHLKMPNGTVLPEHLAIQVQKCTGLVILHDAMLEKLGSIGGMAELVRDLMKMIPKVTTSLASRLGPPVHNTSSFQVATAVSVVQRRSRAGVSTGKAISGELRLAPGDGGSTGGEVRLPVVVEQSEDQPEPSDLDQVEATVQHVSLEDYEMDPDSDIEYISPQGKVIVKAEPVHEQDLKIDESPQVPWAGPSAMNPGMESTSQGMATGRPAGLSDSEAEDSDYGQDTDGFVARAIRNTDGNKAYDSDDVGIARGQPEAKKSKRSPRSEYMARIHQSSDYVVPPDDVKAPWLEPEVELEHEEDLGPLPLPLPPLPFGHVRVSCPDFFEGHKSYPAHEGALNTPPFDCTESLCVARQTWFRFGEYEDMDTQYYDTKTMGDALVDCKMLPGSTYDGSWYAKSRQIFILGKTNKVEPNVSMDWAEIRKLMAQASFFQSCKCGGRVSMDTEGFTVRALRGYAKSERLTSEEQENAFTVLHLCAPNGVMIQIRVLFDGRTVHGLEVPREIRNILKNKGIRKIGFGIEGDVKKLAAMPEPINVRSACNLHHVVLMLWPQPEAYPKQPKTGKWFVKRQLQAPCGLYSKPEDRPEHGAICIRYEEMDFVLCVDDWDDTWSWYNYLDHALAFALMDYASARAADLDHLSAQADIVRYALDILDSVRDLPYGVRNTGRGFGMVKAESDDVRDRVCCHPIVKDFDIFVRFRARLLFENSLIR
jgi:hypothetical protein